MKKLPLLVLLVFLSGPFSRAQSVPTKATLTALMQQAAVPGMQLVYSRRGVVSTYNLGLRKASFRSGPYAGRDVPLAPRRTLALRADWTPAAGHRVGGGVNWVSTQHPDFEVLVRIRVDRSAKVYRDAVARMGSNGLLAEMMIDFVQGNEESGLAERGSTFIGERQLDVSSVAAKAIKTLEPVAAAAEATLKDLKVTVGTLNGFFGQGSDLQASISNIRRVGENFAAQKPSVPAVNMMSGNGT